MDKKYYMGIDVGSTTVKIYLENEQGECVFSKYMRHFSDVKATIETLLKEVKDQFGDLPVNVVMTGSGGLSLSK